MMKQSKYLEAAEAAVKEVDPAYAKYVDRFGPNKLLEEPEQTSSNVIGLHAQATARKLKFEPKPEPETTPYHVILGGCVISVIRSRGQDLMFTEKAAYRYSDGLWSMATDGLSFWLNYEIELAAKYFRQSSTNKLIAEARGWIQRQDDLCRKHNEIEWDAHGMVPTKTGLVNPRTGECRPIRPDDYCTWRIEAEYDPAAECPWWLTMLNDVFADRSEEERAATIVVIQDLLGVGLIDDKPREVSRALVFQGGSNFGKSGLLEVLGGLFGREVNSTTIEALEGAHGKMGFLKRLPWILHEAFDQRKWHFSSDVKTIVTGEPIYVNIKNGPMLSFRVRAPIFWGTNHPPQFKESTRAVTNRLVVIECKREFFEDHPVGAAKEAFRRGLAKPSSLVLNEEMPGLLAWAMVGLKRALERGRLILTKQMSESIDEIRRDSNLVDGFLTECCLYDPDRRLAVPDFCLAFAAWWLENKGENRTPPSNEAIGKALVAMADPKIAIGGEELRDTRRRYHAGLVLNEEGLAFHRAGWESRDLTGKTANATDPKSQINGAIPPQWLEKQSIKTMRKRHMTD
jgi:putative DNA primase/helicase